MRRAVFVILFVLLAIVLSGERAFSQSNEYKSESKKPVILDARADHEQGVVMIGGMNFRCEAIHVLLITVELPVLSCAPTHVLASLPGSLMPATYRLSIYTGSRAASLISIDLAIGAVGPPGPAGPQGLPGRDGELGPAGLTGPQGLQGAQGAPGGDGAAGAQGSSGPSGPMGPIGPLGPIGPTGSQGPIGPPGMSLVMHWTWHAVTMVDWRNGWVPLIGSARQITTNGGPLLIHVNVSMTGGNYSTCAPFIDDKWAGAVEYGGLPTGNPNSPFWREGLVKTFWDWVQWSPTRVYPGVQAGTYTFDVRCATDSGMLTVNSVVNPSYVSIVELK